MDYDTDDDDDNFDDYDRVEGNFGNYYDCGKWWLYWPWQSRGVFWTQSNEIGWKLLPIPVKKASS